AGCSVRCSDGHLDLVFHRTDRDRSSPAPSPPILKWRHESMRITWRDAVTAALAVVVVLAYLAYVASWAVPVVGDVRGATLVIGGAGFAMCIVGGSGSAVMRKDAFLGPLSVLGIGAFLLIVVGLVSAWALV